VSNVHNSDNDKVVYWHRDLPPLDAELMLHRSRRFPVRPVRCACINNPRESVTDQKWY